MLSIGIEHADVNQELDGWLLDAASFLFVQRSNLSLSATFSFFVRTIPAPAVRGKLMRNLSDTVKRLAAFRDASRHGGHSTPDRLHTLTPSTANPGNLVARAYTPPDLEKGAALVVVLHGCTQTAAGYDHGSGWSQLADEYGFALLFPEQQRSNNPNLCFNWFTPEDSRRDGGEAASIRQMIDMMIDRHGIDTRRIFITGLSAGGAMTSVMLATYPEVFSGGAIIAGLPYGTTSTMPEAFDRMRGQGMPPIHELGQKVLGASSHKGPWPTISVWHGTQDHTVTPSNARAILGQWREVHKLARSPTRSEVSDGFPRQVWCDKDGREVIDFISIDGMGHGTPLATTGVDACGAAGPFMLDVGISSTRHIARSWGLTASFERRTSPTAEIVVSPASETRPAAGKADTVLPNLEETPASNAILKTIEDALRSAGLMR